MINVYLDPSSYIFLNNMMFSDTLYNRDNVLLSSRYLREYCLRRNLDLRTIDFWSKDRARATDVYVSFDHKFFPRKLYWKLKNRNYKIVNLGRFQKKILFHSETPLAMPEIKYLYKMTLKTYNKVLFSWKTGCPGIAYFCFPEIHEGVSLECWDNKERKFLTIINKNRKSFFRYKELLTERIRAIVFFSRANEIDLYGHGWESRPLFPYWIYKSAIKKVYKGAVESKYKTLSRYKFALAFENCELPGYVSEKIFDCFYTGTVPVYLGAPDIKEYVPENCFVNMRDFKSYEELRKFLKFLTESEIEHYKENGRRFLESEKYTPFTKEHFAEVFVKAIL